jgi:hypothetical protein
MAIGVPEYSKAVEIGPSFYMPDIDGITDVRKYLEEKTDAQCNFAGCGIRNPPKKSDNIPSLWEKDNPLNIPNVPTLDGEALNGVGKNDNCINCYICGFPIDGRRGVALEIQNTWGGQCEHVMAVAALATLCGLAGKNYDDIVKKFLDECKINDPNYKIWRDRLVNQGNNTKNKEGGGPHGILYKWAHPGCNEIKGSHPYLRIDFEKIAGDGDGWFSDLINASLMSFSGGGMKGGNPEDIFCDEVMRWNLACVSGLNKGDKSTTDGGKKSMYWRKRYNLYKSGIKNINVDGGTFVQDLKDLIGLYAQLYSIDKSDKAGKKNKAAEIKLKQRELIKGDNSLSTIELIKDGVSEGEKPTIDWIDERTKHMKETILRPIIANIVNVVGDDEETKSATLRKYICISQCILTQVFEKNLISAVAKLDPSSQQNWSYAPASQLSSMIIGLAFDEITDSSDTDKLMEIKKKYEERIKDIPRSVIDSIKVIKKKVKGNLSNVKKVLQTKKLSIKSSIKKTGAKIKNKISSSNSFNLQTRYSLRKRKKGGHKNNERREKIRKKYLGGKRGKIPYRIFTFTSNDRELEKIIKRKQHAIYSNDLEWSKNRYHKLSPSGECRISKWLTLLLVEHLDIDQKYIDNYDYRLNINHDPTKSLPLYFTINVSVIKKKKEYSNSIGRIPIDIEKDIFKSDDKVYNLAMFMYLTVLSMNNNITKYFIKELEYLFNLNFMKRLEMMGIKSKKNDPKIKIRTLKKPRVRETMVYSKTSTTGRTKRNKKKDKIKRYYMGGDKVYSPSLDGLIAANNIFNNNGPNYISDYMLHNFVNDDGSYKSLINAESQFIDIGNTEYEKAFIDIIKVDDSDFDYEDNTEYREISKPGVDMGFDKDPVFSQLMSPGKTEIKVLGILIKDKWTQAGIQYDDRDIRIFYILGMIDYLTNIKIFSNNGSDGDDPVIDYLTSDDNPISVFSEEYEGESKYYEEVKGRCTELLKDFPESLQRDLLSYFGKSYGIDGSDESIIHDTIEGVGDIYTKIANFVCNITIINVLTYPYVRCYVTYDPAFKRYMWNYDSIGSDNDGSEITNFCRAKNRRIQKIRAEDLYGSINPYRLAYEEDNEPLVGGSVESS